MINTASTILGIDVGGTKIAAGLVSFPEGFVRSRREIPTRPERSGDFVLADVELLVSDLAAENKAAGRSLDGIGVGICELVDLQGQAVSAHSIDWQDLKLRTRLSQFAPMVLEADVRAAARAEALFGAGRDEQNFLYISIGTGIASCLVIEGRPFLGARGATGTMASGPLPPPPGSVPAPTPINIESFSSGPALVARFNALGGTAQTGNDVMTAEARGDTRAREVIRTGAETLGAAIGGLVNVLDPARVVLGGGLGLCPGLYRETLIEAARRHIWWAGHRNLPIVSAETGLDAGLIGAAASAWISNADRDNARHPRGRWQSTPQRTNR